MSSAPSRLFVSAAVAVLVTVATIPAQAQKSAASSKGSSGSRGLSLERLEHMDFPAITAGQTVHGSLSSSDLTRDDDTYADGFLYDGHAGETITVTLRSGDFDAWLVVDDPNGSMDEFNDDDGGGTDAMLTVTLPHDGRYLILANTVLPNSTGDYTLTLTTGKSGGSGGKGASPQRGLSIAEIDRMDFPSITSGQTVNGSLTTSDLMRDDNTYADGFSYDGRAGERITVTMRSSDLDSWLVLDDPNGTMHEYDDDSAGGSDARLTITLPHDGRYIILANTVNPRSTGSYTLTVARGK